MTAMTSHDPEFLKLLRLLGAPENLTSFELLAGVEKIVSVRCTYLQPLVKSERMAQVVENFELVTKAEMEELRGIRRALAALDERARELQPDGMGYLAIGRIQEHFAAEIAAARKAERLPK